MRIIGSILFIFFTTLYCQSVRLSQKKVSGIIVERKFPNLEWDSLKNRMILTHFDTLYTKIYYYKKQVLIQSNQQYRNLNLTGLNEDEAQDLIKNAPYQTRYYTFVYSDDINTCLFWYNTNIESSRILNKDSMLLSEWALSPRREDLFKNNYRTLISSKASGGGKVIEEYTFRNKKDTTMTGRIILTFSKNGFDEIEYSMAKEIELEKKMKLIKIVSINNARYIPPSNTYIERVELPYELKKITITNEEELIKMFETAKAILR